MKELQGQSAELLALTECVRRGFRVCLPFAGKAPYDFVLEGQHGFSRIQIKEIYHGRTDNGHRWMVDFMKPKGSSRNLRYAKYTIRDCDFLVGVCVSHSRFYVFPVDVITAKRQATFYFDAPASSLARNHGWTDSYEDAWPT